MTRRLDFDALLADAAASELSDGFFARHLREVDRTVARAEVLDRLAVPELDQTPAVVLGRTLAALDPVPVLERVLDVIADYDVDDNARFACYAAVVTLPHAVLAKAVGGALHRVAGLEYARVYCAVLAAYELPDARGVVHALAKGVPAAQRAKWATFLEAIRQRADVPAAVLYAPLLGDATLAADDGARKVWLDALVGEADEAGAALLQKLRAGAPKKLRAPFQVALLKLETARADGAGAGAADDARLWASQPDGKGAVAALVAFASPDGANTVVNLCFRLAGDLRQGFVQPRTSERELAEMIQTLTAGSTKVTRAPAGEFATVVDAAVASHKRTGRPMPRECEPALRALDRLPRVALPASPPAAAVDVDRMEEILEDERFEHWFFDAEDLGLHAGRANADDSVAVLVALAGSPMRDRVEAMARYMVHWSRWKGDAPEAGEWAAIADDVTQDFAASPLAWAMLDASDEVPVALPRRGGGPVADYGAEGILIGFAELFSELAVLETQTLRFQKHPHIPDGEYVLGEFLCTARSCNCQRITFAVKRGRANQEIFRIGYAFTEEAAKRFHTPRTVLYPSRSNPPWADAMVREVDARMKSDPAWQATVMRHYALARSL